MLLGSTRTINTLTSWNLQIWSHPHEELVFLLLEHLLWVSSWLQSSFFCIWSYFKQISRFLSQFGREHIWNWWEWWQARDRLEATRFATWDKTAEARCQSLGSPGSQRAWRPGTDSMRLLSHSQRLWYSQLCYHKVVPLKLSTATQMRGLRDIIFEKRGGLRSW
jgi:hypothetical protein